MFINEEEIKFKNFQTMCRTCLKSSNLKSIKNNFIIEVLHNITDINYRIDEELPQNICDICIKKINEIQAFAFQCIEIDLTLRKCHKTFKKNSEFDEENIEKKPEINETTPNIKEIKKEFPDDEITSNNQIQFYEIKDLNFDQNVINIDEATNETFEKWFTKTNDIDYSYVTFSQENDENSDTGSVNSTNLNIIETEESPKTKRKPEYHCTLCNLEFSNMKLYSEHEQIYHLPKRTEDEDLSCEVCRKTYKTKSGIKHHRKVYFHQVHYSCDICHKIYKKLPDFEAHKRKHKFNKYLGCTFCGKVFPKARSLRKHVKIVHCKKCDVCLKEFHNVTMMKMHQKMHQN